MVGTESKNLMDNDKHHQGEKIKSKESASARTQPRSLQFRGRVPEPQTTQDREYLEYEEVDHLGSDQSGQRPTYDYDQDYQEHSGSQTYLKMKKKMNTTKKTKREALMDVTKKNIDDHNMMMKTTPQGLEKSTMKLLLSRRRS